jgi:hypothetical protein
MPNVGERFNFYFWYSLEDDDFNNVDTMSPECLVARALLLTKPSSQSAVF